MFHCKHLQHNYISTLITIRISPNEAVLFSQTHLHRSHTTKHVNITMSHTVLYCLFYTHLPDYPWISRVLAAAGTLAVTGSVLVVNSNHVQPTWRYSDHCRLYYNPVTIHVWCPRSAKTIVLPAPLSNERVWFHTCSTVAMPVRQRISPCNTTWPWASVDTNFSPSLHPCHWASSRWALLRRCCQRLMKMTREAPRGTEQ